MAILASGKTHTMLPKLCVALGGPSIPGGDPKPILSAWAGLKINSGQDVDKWMDCG